MEIFCIEMADTVIEIHSLYRDVKELCKEYLCRKKPQIQIIIRQEDIEYERKKGAEGFRDGYLETLAVYRRIVRELAERGFFLMHGSAVAVDGKAYLFTAPSGTGKSTHTRLWCEVFGHRALMVNDDKPLIKIEDKQVWIYGTPWNGKHNRGNNLKMPLQAVCFLHQAKENQIVKKSYRDLYPRLLNVIYLPLEDTKAVSKVMVLIDGLRQIPMYEMGCTISREAAAIAYEKMKGE